MCSMYNPTAYTVWELHPQWLTNTLLEKFMPGLSEPLLRPNGTPPGIDADAFSMQQYFSCRILQVILANKYIRYCQPLAINSWSLNSMRTEV